MKTQSAKMKLRKWIMSGKSITPLQALDKFGIFRLGARILELRREGDVLGATQSGGRSSLRLLRVIQDSELIQKIRLEVEELFESDPNLENLPVLTAILEQVNSAENLAKG